MVNIIRNIGWGETEICINLSWLSLSHFITCHKIAIKIIHMHGKNTSAIFHCLQKYVSLNIIRIYEILDYFLVLSVFLVLIGNIQDIFAKF